MTKTVVIGAGICGVSAALWLQRLGSEVILIDKGAPGMGASFGNAGLLAQWAVVPVTTPSLWRDAPKYLFNPDSPLFMKWGYFPKMLPWLAKYMAQANDTATEQTVKNLIPLLNDAVDQHRSLTHDTPVGRWIRDSKFSYAYSSRAQFDADTYGWQLKKQAGFTPNLITGEAVQEEEPILGPATRCLAVLEGQGHVTNPGQYIAELAALFQQQGGRFIQSEVKDIQIIDGKLRRVETASDSIECDTAIITAGIWSKDLMKKLKLTVPLETERGYHVLYKNPSQMPRNPMMMTSHKFAVNPMEMGLRCAGTVELGDHIAGPSAAPLRFIRQHVAALFPDLTYTGTEEWMGFRPSTPDSLPLIGQIGETGLYTGFGHQHVGLTAGPKTGRLLAQLINGQTPNIDMAPYDPARYRVCAAK